MAQKNNHLVIMAGGVGSRFWPMSTAEKPKQFIDVLGVGKTLLQLTVERFGKLVAPENIWVVTNQRCLQRIFCANLAAEILHHVLPTFHGVSSQKTRKQTLW